MADAIEDLPIRFAGALAPYLGAPKLTGVGEPPGMVDVSPKNKTAPAFRPGRL